MAPILSPPSSPSTPTRQHFPNTGTGFVQSTHTPIRPTAELCGVLVYEVKASEEIIWTTLDGIAHNLTGSLWAEVSASGEPNHLFVVMDLPNKAGEKEEICYIIDAKNHLPVKENTVGHYFGQAFRVAYGVGGAVLTVTGAIVYTSKVKRAIHRLKPNGETMMKYLRESFPEVHRAVFATWQYVGNRLAITERAPTPIELAEQGRAPAPEHTRRD